jgi:hypothetical protein
LRRACNNNTSLLAKLEKRHLIEPKLKSSQRMNLTLKTFFVFFNISVIAGPLPCTINDWGEALAPTYRSIFKRNSSPNLSAILGGVIAGGMILVILICIIIYHYRSEWFTLNPEDAYVARLPSDGSGRVSSGRSGHRSRDQRHRDRQRPASRPPRVSPTPPPNHSIGMVNLGVAPTIDATASISTIGSVNNIKAERVGG